MHQPILASRAFIQHFWLGIQIHVGPHITLDPLMHITKHEMEFFWKIWGGEKLERKRSLAHALKHRISLHLGASFC